MTILRRLINWLSIYVPVFLLGALALGSYFLARYTPAPAPFAEQAPARHVPDYFMNDFAVRTFESTGTLKSEVFGQELRHYPDTDTTEIDNPRIRNTNTQGKISQSTAQRAVTNADGSEVQLLGNVLIVREQTSPNDKRVEFRGEFIHAFIAKDQLKSHKPVNIVLGGDRFSADAFSYDHADGIVELNGRVTGQLSPRLKP